MPKDALLPYSLSGSRIAYWGGMTTKVNSGHRGDREGRPALATTDDIAAVAGAAAASGRLGIDTEFMSEGRYRALLCLVQVGVDDPTVGTRRRSF